MQTRYALALAALSVSLASCGSEYLDGVRADLFVGNYAEAEAALKRALYDDPGDAEAASHLVAAQLLQLPDTALTGGGRDALRVQAALFLEPENFERFEPDHQTLARKWVGDAKAAVRQRLRRDGIETATFDDVQAIALGAAGVIADLCDERMRRAGSISEHEERLLIMARVLQARSGDEGAAGLLIQHVSATGEGYSLEAIARLVGAPLLAPLEAELAKPEPLLPARDLQLALAWVRVSDEAASFARDYPALRRVRRTDVPEEHHEWWNERYDWTSAMWHPDAADEWEIAEAVAASAMVTASAPAVPGRTAVEVVFFDTLNDFDYDPVEVAADKATGVFMLQGYDPESRAWVMRFVAVDGASMTRMRRPGEGGASDVTSREPVMAWGQLGATTLAIALPPGTRAERYADVEEYYNPDKYSGGYYYRTRGGYDVREVVRTRDVPFDRALLVPVSIERGSLGAARASEHQFVD